MLLFLHNFTVDLTYRFPLRIEAMLLRMEFSEKLEDLKPAIATLEQAIDELMSCDMLRDVLEVILTAGNIINGVS